MTRLCHHSHLCVSRLRRSLTVALVSLAFVLGVTGTSRAQSIWEVSPYKIEVWVALEPQARLDREWQEELPARLQTLAGSRVGAVWQLEARAVPTEFLADVLRETELDLERLKDTQPRLADADKLVLVWVQSDPGGYRISAREVDLSTRRWSMAERVVVPRIAGIIPHALNLVCEIFVPLVRIERIDESRVTVAVRGGALERPETSVRRWQVPTQVQVGDVLQCVLLRADRNGNIGPDGVKLVEWTVLIVKERQGSLLTCEFQSGFRQPFATRRNSRIQQLAYLVKPRLDATTLRLVNRQAPDQPLVGYEVYARGLDEKQVPQLVGRTDWRGEIRIERDAEDPVKVLLVRNGQQLLGKLPVVAGEQPQLVAPLRNDELRLEAEGFLLGVQDSLVDLVARREVLASRIRRAIEADELEKADTLLRELRQLDTQEDFARRVEQRKRTLSSVDAQVQQKIDELFAQTRSLLGKYLSQDQVDELSRALDAAKAQ